MRSTNQILIVAVATLVLGVGCSRKRQQEKSFSSIDISNVITEMTALMIHDVTNPPLAARFFSYATLAGYEVVAQNDPAYPPMHGVLRDYPKMAKPDTITGYSYTLSAILAMLATAKKMQPSGPMLQQYEDHLLDSCRQMGFEEETIEQSQKYALAVSKKILAYAKADGYNKISNYKRYTPLNTEGTWYPTPPTFIAAVEPYFNTVRSFTLDTCSQFEPTPPIPFSAAKQSAFYQLMLQNYTDTLTAAKKEIAAFWDCNPFAVQDNGHLQVGIKKISPGAHWLGITGIACIQGNKNFQESMQIYTSVAVGLMDAFICCWDEKYRSNRIRPETAIRKYIDPTWTPLIQSPPFPEYLSGHSTISATSATILTHYFGDNFKYTDSVEVRYQLPSRTFTSFQQAATEAGISRFYGGIHFMDAIDNGRKQGLRVGDWVVNKLKPLQVSRK